MTEIQFTQRTADVFKRVIETRTEMWEKMCAGIQQETAIDELHDINLVESHDGWDLNMTIYADYDDEIEEYEWDNVHIRIMIDRRQGDHTSIYGLTMLSTYTPASFDELVKTYYMCVDCNEAYCWKQTNFCVKCYPFVMEYIEDCCCCLDKTLGVWYKLPCGHILHQRCYNKIEKERTGASARKCPLCRAVSELSATEKL